jgi:hypothetical protein
MTKADKIRDLYLDREGYVCGLGADPISDKSIRAEIRKIDCKLAGFPKSLREKVRADLLKRHEIVGLKQGATVHVE